MTLSHRYNPNYRNSRGVVLLITLIVLVVLSILGYTLSTKVAAQRHRNRYVVDYSQARYACDSALKYALIALQGLEPQVIARPNEPDFSDLYALTEQEYQQLLTEISTAAMEADGGFGFPPDEGEPNDLGVLDGWDSSSDLTANNDPNVVVIPGPYGPPWPLVQEPIEFEISTAKVTIEIEDENAKYPLGWALLTEPEIEHQAQVGFETFLEWMRYGVDEIGALYDQLARVGEVRPFKAEFKPLTLAVKRPTPTSSSSDRPGIPRTPRLAVTRKTISVEEQIADQTTDFSKLFNSPLLDKDLLMSGPNEGLPPREPPLKYISLWGTRKVNVNTAPRHVLEAAFTFGGLSAASDIAQGVIVNRRIKPIENIDELKQALFGHSDSIAKCENFISTTSTIFTIRIKASSGVATASAVAAVVKQGDKIKPLGVLSD